MVRRTKEEAQATRETIIDAAEKVFHEKGVAHASLEEIAHAAGCTRGAIYWHFKDKADLFDAMMDRVVLPVEAMLDRATQAGATDPLAILRLATIEVLQRTARDAHLQRVFDIAYHKCEYVGDAAGVRERHIASQQECLGSIEAGFHACIEQGYLPKSVSAKEAAIGAMSLVSGLIANWVLDPKSFSLSRHAESLVDIYFRGLQSTPVTAQEPRSKPAPRARLKSVK
ncbi:HTH-type transcriptional regulator AcrR [Usitatibacter rugosus]|uniref:HTH-type transcriptional regulator AcrR n=1 Tax=Usitatibacter rugosus TaxID=2732067 RepID=A0A6M4GZU6_9PROT|nr:TetR family transcriptional regulator [Usitatibacter rugosus]QJR11943.1 HTH-type transcriptional regulator AcrR [Usitatibacter rugosus]